MSIIDCAKPAREKEIPERFDALDSVLMSLEKELEILTSKIVPIMSPRNDGSDVLGGENVLYTCDVAQRIQSYITRIGDLRDGVSELIRRIEL